MSTGGIVSTRLRRVCKSLVGHLTGGLGAVAVLAPALERFPAAMPQLLPPIGGVLNKPMAEKGSRPANTRRQTIAAARCDRHRSFPVNSLILYGFRKQVFRSQICFSPGLFPGILICNLVLIMNRYLSVAKKLKNGIFKGRAEICAASKQAFWPAFDASHHPVWHLWRQFSTPTEPLIVCSPLTPDCRFCLRETHLSGPCQSNSPARLCLPAV